jgi:oxamate amidohydrolase
MLTPALGFGGAFTAPHRAAALAGRDVLAAGGTAIEAMVAAAAVIAVAYPHMNGIGGDGFWLVHRPGARPSASPAAAAPPPSPRPTGMPSAATPTRFPPAARSLP